jgi:hypothetical protein
MPLLKRARVDDAAYAYFDGVVLDVEATRDQLAAAVERKLTDARELGHPAENEV